MSHIFISYSRKDIDFAQKIVTALAENDLDTWIDWKSIPKGEDWEQEIYRGIEEADAFLFLISPDSVQSQMCNKEVTHAHNNGKRILPILIRDTEPKGIRPQISKLNWIFCRASQDDFKTSITEIRKAIHTDYEWLKYHTKLQVKALDWERQKDHSRLLRGSELREAKQIVISTIRKDPKPTYLQQQYVWASLRNETHRRNILIIAMLVTLTVISTLGAYGLWQTILGNERANIVNVEEVSRLANSRMNERLDLGFLLSAEAFKRLDNNQTRTSLLSALQVSPRLRQFYFGFAQPSDSTSFSKDGRLFASAHCEKSLQDNCAEVKIELWDIMQRHLMGELSTSSSVLLGRIAFSSDSKFLAFNSCKNLGEEVGCLQEEISIWEISNLRLVKTFSFETRISFLGFDSNTHALIAAGCGKPALYACDEGKIVVWDTNTWQIILTPTVGYSDEITSAAISPDGYTLATGNENFSTDSPNDCTITLWDLRSGKQIGGPLLGHKGWINGLAFSPNGQVLASGGYDNTIILWDVNNQVAIGNPLAGHTKQINSILFSHHGEFLVSGSDDKSLILWDIRAGKMLGRSLTGHSAEVQEIALSPDDHLLYSSGKDGIVARWDLTDGELLTQILQVTNGSINEIAISYDGRILIAGGCREFDDPYFCKEGQIIMWDTATRQMIGQPLLVADGEINHVAISPDNKRFAATVWDQTILWDMVSREQIGKPVWGGEAIAFSPDSKTLVIGGCGKEGTSVTCEQGQITLVDSSNGQMITEPVLDHTERVTSLAFNTSGDLLATGSYDGVNFWDLTNIPAIQKSFGLVTKYAEGMIFTPTDNSLILAGYDSMTVWNITNRKMVGQSFGGGAPVDGGRGGRLLVSNNQNNGVELWDISNIANPVQIGDVLSEHKFITKSVAINEANRMVTSLNCHSSNTNGEEGSCQQWDITIWNIDPTLWLQHVCEIVGRNFTQAEWAQYFPDEPYRITCPQWPAGQ